MFGSLIERLLFTKKGLIALVAIACLMGIAIAAAVGSYVWALFGAGLLITVLSVGGRSTAKFFGAGKEFFTFGAGAGVMLMALPFILTEILRCGP